jgi:hypothetical protein
LDFIGRSPSPILQDLFQTLIAFGCLHGGVRSLSYKAWKDSKRKGTGKLTGENIQAEIRDSPGKRLNDDKKVLF